MSGLTYRLINGDVCQSLAALPPASIQCVVTSPPYWGLRDYGIPSSSWPAIAYAPMGGLPDNTVPAWDGQLGLEPTPEMFVAHVVHVFRHVRDALKDDGVCWVNFGDTYATGAGRVGEHPGGGEQGAKWKGSSESRGYRGDRLANGRKESIHRKKTARGGHEGKHGYLGAIGPGTQPNRMPIDGLKPKDLIGIPWRVAFALQADGWWMRSDVIWHKPNPMPESVQDRPTKAHEYVFLLAKSEDYFYDAAAIRERAVTTASGNSERKFRGEHGGVEGGRAHQGFGVPWEDDGSGRNKRSVWTVGTQPFPDAHFATMPEQLALPCILAGSRFGDTVLDPFNGAATTGVVALKQGRHYVGVELNSEYVEISRRRLSNVAPLLGVSEVAA